jgi:hypothetical protein
MATNRPPSKRVREGRDGILDVPLRNRDHDIWRRAAVRLSRSTTNPCQRIKLIQPMTTASPAFWLIGEHRPSELIGFRPLSGSFSTIKFPHGSTEGVKPSREKLLWWWAVLSVNVYPGGAATMVNSAVQRHTYSGPPDHLKTRPPSTVCRSGSLGDLALHVRGLLRQNRPCPYRMDIELTPQLTALMVRTGTGGGGEVGISEFQVVRVTQSRDGSQRRDYHRHEHGYGYHAPPRRHLGHGRAHRCEQCDTADLSSHPAMCYNSITGDLTSTCGPAPVGEQLKRKQPQ